MPGGPRDRFGIAALGAVICVVRVEYPKDRVVPKSVLCFRPGEL